jgi:hypothetical protein
VTTYGTDRYVAAAVREPAKASASWVGDDGAQLSCSTEEADGSRAPREG